mgnify:CR=1 FL=1
MPGFDNQTYLWMLLASNLVALLQLFAAIFWPRIARYSFVLLFAWACWMNWTTAISNPRAYLEYADLALFDWTRSFINGWFGRNTLLMVGFIATCQGIIAIGLMLKGWKFMVACIGGILFLLAIVPLGVGSGFPCSIIMAIALTIILLKYGRREQLEKA